MLDYSLGPIEIDGVALEGYDSFFVDFAQECSRKGDIRVFNSDDLLPTVTFTGFDPDFLNLLFTEPIEARSHVQIGGLPW